MQQALN